LYKPFFTLKLRVIFRHTATSNTIFLIQAQSQRFNFFSSSFNFRVKTAPPQQRVYALFNHNFREVRKETAVQTQAFVKTFSANAGCIICSDQRLGRFKCPNLAIAGLETWSQQRHPTPSS
jgi:hypothetical protein